MLGNSYNTNEQSQYWNISTSKCAHLSLGDTITFAHPKHSSGQGYLFYLISFKWPIQTLQWPLLLIIWKNWAQSWFHPLWCSSANQPAAKSLSSLLLLLLQAAAHSADFCFAKNVLRHCLMSAESVQTSWCNTRNSFWI